MTQDDDDSMDHMVETRRVRLESYHYCDAQEDNDWMDHMAVLEWDQLEGDTKEKEKLSAGAAVVHSDLESHHESNMDETNMDDHKWLQLEKDAQEKEKMTESGEDDCQWIITWVPAWISAWMLTWIVTWIVTWLLCWVMHWQNWDHSRWTNTYGRGIMKSWWYEEDLE